MKRKISFIILAVILTMALITGCSTAEETTDTKTQKDDTSSQGSSSTEENDPGEEKVHIQLMMHGTDADSDYDNFLDVIETFNETNTHNAVIEAEFYENEQYKTKLATLMAANDVPDIFFTWPLAYLEPFVNGGLVADITDYLDEDQAWKDSFSDGTLEQITYDGRIYGVPTQKTITAMFYNQAIFEENGVALPTTYEEFMAACETFKVNGIIPMAMSGTDSWIPAQFLQQLSNGIGGYDLYAGVYAGDKQWNDPAYIEAGQELQRMVENGYFQDGFIGMGPDESRQLFMTGQSAMYFMGQWDASMLISDQSTVADQVGAFTIPAKYSENNNISVGSADFAFGIAENCENKDAAVAFIKYWSSVEVEETFLYEEGRTPAAVFDIDESQLDPLFVKVLEISNGQKGLTPWFDRAFGAGEGTEFNNTAVAIAAGEDAQEMFDALQQFAEDNADR